MIIVKLQGGLGNQMFQYACGRAVSLKHDVPLYLDVTGFPDHNDRVYELEDFKINAKKIEKTQALFDSLFKKKVFEFEEKVPYRYYDSIFHQKNIRLNGYFQNPLYFNSIRGLLKKEFSVSEIIMQNSLFDKVLNCESVAIHIRRTDYIQSEIVSNELGFCGIDYFLKCIDYVSRKTDSPHFFFFSDDIEWCRRNFSFLASREFCDLKNKHQEILLISKCKHQIISNSTFGWWGAYLKTYSSGLVLAPEPWWKSKKWDVSDLILPEWIKILRS